MVSISDSISVPFLKSNIVMASKRKNLSMSDKLSVLKAAENSSRRNVAAKFGISVGAVNNILKWKRDILDHAEDNCNPETKRL